MSAFRVMGVSRLRCREMAKKQIDRMAERQRPRTQEEYRQELDARTARLFEIDAGPVQLARYDAPQFAIDYVRLAERQPGEFRDMRVEEYRVSDRVDPKTGRHTRYWAPLSVYQPS